MFFRIVLFLRLIPSFLYHFPLEQLAKYFYFSPLLFFVISSAFSFGFLSIFSHLFRSRHWHLSWPLQLSFLLLLLLGSHFLECQFFLSLNLLLGQFFCNFLGNLFLSPTICTFLLSATVTILRILPKFWAFLTSNPGVSFCWTCRSLIGWSKGTLLTFLAVPELFRAR